MTKCCIRGCDSDLRKNNKELSFFRFPTKEALNKLWTNNIGTDNIKPTRVKRICSNHFEDNCINRTLNVVRLKDDVMPTLFPHNNYKPTNTNTQQLQSRTMEIDTSINSKESTRESAGQTTYKMEKLCQLVQSQKKKIKILRQKCRRLKQRVLRFQNMIDDLKKRNSIPPEVKFIRLCRVP